jgi:hypothetical protein
MKNLFELSNNLEKWKEKCGIFTSTVIVKLEPGVRAESALK